MTTFVHTIGGYYRDPAKFIKEAKAVGVNRRVAQHLLSKFSFGDVVMVLDWNGKVKGRGSRAVGKKGLRVPKKVIAYGQFVVERLSFQASVMAVLAEELLAEGEVAEVRQVDGGGAVVERECGSYIDAGGVVIRHDSKLTLKDLLARAKAIGEGLGIAKLETFVGGRFQAFREPIEVERPPFQMGFWEVEASPVRKPSGTDKAEVSGIGSYHLRVHAKREDPLLGLLPAPAPDEGKAEEGADEDDDSAQE